MVLLGYTEEGIKVYNYKYFVLTENTKDTQLSVKLLSHTTNPQRKYYTSNSCEFANNIKFSISQSFNKNGPGSSPINACS